MPIRTGYKLIWITMVLLMWYYNDKKHIYTYILYKRVFPYER